MRQDSQGPGDKKNNFYNFLQVKAVSLLTRPAWAGFKTAEEGWAKIMKVSK